MSGVQGLKQWYERKIFDSQIVQALPVTDPNPVLTIRSTAQAYANSQAPVWFTIRCVLERPNCESSVAFQMAAFFDADGPRRSVRSEKCRHLERHTRFAHQRRGVPAVLSGFLHASVC